MNLFYILLVGLLAFLVSVTIILFLIGPILLLHPRRRNADFYRKLGLPTTPAEAKIEAEEITLLTSAGIPLKCWLVKSPAPRGTVIYLHGVGDCKIDGLRFSSLLQQNGYNVFLYDARRHGESGGTYCTYGYYEKQDVSAIIDYLQERKDFSTGKIALFGTSMGAAVALQAAELDKRVSAVIAENSFATLRTIFDDYQKRMIKVPFHYLRNVVIARSEMMANFKAREVSPLDAIARIHVPVLFIYGEEDHLIDYRYSLSLYERANQPKDFLAIEKARHNDTWSVGGEKYERKVLNFLETYIALTDGKIAR